ncbi:MAG TPA: CocE/NonD family hydrolase, partial [Spongiibacteraceae bacterium]|nr:CocE/NonD family hydrolase [Spongiibacteraceae bacterium]
AQRTYAGNSLMLENALSWTRMMTLMKRPSLLMLSFLLERLFKIPAIRREQWKTLPLASMDKHVIGERVHFWQDWMQHSSASDPWWAPMSHRQSIAMIKRPITMVAGWHDIFLPWQLQDFIALRAANGETRITIGPWSHTDMRLVRAGWHDAIDWFNRHLLGKNTPTQKPIKLYVIGANAWREFDTWPPQDSQVENWYLQPQRQLRDCIAPDSESDQYRYDPDDPTPSLGGPNLFSGNATVDNAELEARADVLTYTSEPLTQYKDIIGPVAAEIYATSSADSADFFVRLCDVDESGISQNICDGLQRVTIQANKAPQRVRIELWPTAYRIERGHRLRVQISSGAFPRWARNAGTTEPIAQQTELHAATQAIFHSPKYPSAITLSIFDNH